MKKLCTFILVLVGFCLPVFAQAASYTYDFASLPQVSYEGATLDLMTLTSEVPGEVKNYLNISIIGLAGNDPQTMGASADIYMTFSSPINSFSITAGDEGGDLDRFGIYAYEFGTNNLLDTVVTPIFNGTENPADWLYTLNYSRANIGKVVFDPGNSEVWPGTFYGSGGQLVTNIAYNTAVPEPATMLLLGSGLLGILGLRRKFRK